jgi:hypothetical protein
LEKDVVDRTADEGTEAEEFAVDPMQSRLEKVPFSRVLAIKEIQKLKRSGRSG